MEIFAEQFRQAYWANARVINWIGNNQKDADAINKLMCHILNAETIWLNRVLQSEYDKDRFRIHGLDKLPGINLDNKTGFLSLLSRDPKEIIAYELMNGNSAQSRIKDILFHVITHGFHHRGQMAILASNMKIEFPGVSFIEYAREVP